MAQEHNREIELIDVALSSAEHYYDANILSHASQDLKAATITVEEIESRSVSTSEDGASDNNSERTVDHESLSGSDVDESESSVQCRILTPTEQLLRSLWSRVLGRPCDDIDVDDNFMQLGGDSLSALRLVGEAREAGIRVGVLDLMQRPILAQMAKSIDEYQQNAAKAAANDPNPFELWCPQAIDETPPENQLRELAMSCGIDDTARVEDVYPCTPMQEGLLVISAQRKGAYSMQNVFTLGCDVDVDRFQLALIRMIDMLAILRTRIVASASGSLQVVIRDGTQVARASDLRKFLEADRSMEFSHGTSLHRFAIVSENESSSGIKHSFVWSAHHAAFDGWSMFKMFSFLLATYKNIPDFSPSPIPRYIRHITRLKERDESCREFWRSQMNGIALTQFPQLPHRTYHPQAASTLSCTISGDQYERKHPTAIILRAAWAVVVATYAGFAEEATTNVVLSGREIPVLDIEDMIAPAVVTVPVRVQLDWSQQVSQLLASVHRQAQSMTPHTYWGLHEIGDAVVDLTPTIDPGHLFVVYPSFKDESDAVIQALGLKLESAANFTFDDFALSVECTVDSRSETTEVLLRFDEHVISKPAAEVLISYYRHIISQFELCNNAVAPHDVPLHDLSLLCTKSLDLVRKHNIEPTQGMRICVHDLIQEVIEKQPGSIAVDAWDGPLTFAELGMHAQTVARQLIHCGIQPGMSVGLCLSKSKWSAVAILGILEAGGAVVPLGTSHPLARIEIIAADCAMTVAIMDSTQSARLGDIVSKQVILNDEYFEVFSAREPRLRTGVTPNDVCWISYTSGSTGTPKGVLLEHVAYSTSITAQSRRDGFSQHTRTLQFADHTYDAVVEETLATWIGGGCSCIPSEEQRLNDLPKFLRAKRINFIAATPSLTSVFQPADVPTLRTITLGGEAVRSSDVESWLAAGNIEVMNSYGPTECSVIASQSLPMCSARQAANIGKPLAGRFWVVSPQNHNRLCPFGVPGELFIESPTLARGYLNDPAKTEMSFVHRPPFLDGFPFSESDDMKHEQGVRVYRTGDLVKQEHDGTFVHLGRCDTQLKIRGQRIESSEVESHLSRLLPAARQAFVDVVELDEVPGAPLLLAVVEIPMPVTSAGAPSEDIITVIQDATAALYDALPPYAVPRHIIPVPKMALSPSGKLDRRAARAFLKAIRLDQLKALDTATGNEIRDFTDSELKLRDLWAQVLGRDKSQIRVFDHFRQLGGDSITAMRLVALARKSEMHLDVADIFRAPRLNELAKVLEGHAAAALMAAAKDPEPFQLCCGQGVNSQDDIKAYANRLAELCSVPVDMIEDAYPCTSLGEGLMAITASQPGTYAAQFVFRTSLDFDAMRFKHAIGVLWDLLPVLRTRIVFHNAKSIQVVIRQSLQWYEGSNLESYLDQDRENHFAYGMPLHRFAIIASPISDALTNSQDDQHRVRPTYFVWSAHHSVYDGWSMYRLMEILTGLYTKKQTSLPALTPIPRFIDWVERLQSQEENVSKYWQGQLAGSSYVQFPPAKSKSYQPQAKSVVREGLGGKHRHDVSTATLLRATWAIVVATYTGSSEALLAISLSGRDAPVVGIADIVAPTLTTVPVRICIDKDQSVADYLALVQRQSDDMVVYAHTGVQAMRSLPGTGSKLDPGHVFIIQPEPGPHLDILLGTLNLEPITQDAPDFTGYPLAVACHVRADTEHVELEIRFDDEVVSPFLAKSLVSSFKNIWIQLGSMDTRGHVSSNNESMCNLKLRDLMLMCPDDAAHLVEEQRHVPQPVQSCLQQLVHDTVLQKPKAMAINAWDGDLTYQELEHRAFQLAVHLQRIGVGPEVKIGLCMDKSRWAIVAMLAILSAGGTVVPLGVNHPIDAVAAVIEDAAIQIALVDEGHAKRLLSHLDCLTIDEALFARLPPYVSGLVMGHPSDAAWIVYTSGSTGKPKGVVLLHETLCTTLLAVGDRWGLCDRTRSVQFTAHTFDAVISDTFATLFRGGCICIPSEIDRIQNLPFFMQSAKVNFAMLTPTMANLIDPKDVPELERLVLIGEAVPSAVVDRWTGHVVAVLNSYGPAECSINSSCSQPLTSGTEAAIIGTKLCGPLWIVDPSDHNRLTAVGAPGELLVEGPLLARGYLNNLEKTAKAFIFDPKFAAKLGLPAGRRMYRTGDMVQQIDSSGTLAFLERRDDQIKVRGQRMEKSAVESQILSSCAAVQHVCVDLITPQDAQNVSLLVAVLELQHSPTDMTLHPTLQSDVEAVRIIRGALRCSLPSFMIPAHFIVVPRMPINMSGKLDRLAVRQSLLSMSRQDMRAQDQQDECAMTYVWTPTAERLRGAWAVVLQLPESDISAGDEFDQLGGDSVTAMRLIAVARSMDLKFGVADVLQYPRLADLARKAEENASSVSRAVLEDTNPMQLWEEHRDSTEADDKASLVELLAEACNVASNNIADVYPCTPLQEALMAVTSHNPNAYVAQLVFRITANLDVVRFRESWTKLYASLPTLRTRIAYSPNGTCVQVLTRHNDPQWLTHSNLPQYLEMDRSHTMSYGEPLYRLGMIHDQHATSPTRGEYFVLTAHHSMYDGWSMVQMIKALVGIYNGHEPEAFTPMTRFLKYLATVDQEKERAFWHHQLKDSQPTPFPALPNPSYRPRLNASVEVPIPRGGLRSTVSIPTILRAAWAIVVATFTGSKDVTIAVALSGRDAPVAEIENIAGPTIAVVPVRIKLDDRQEVLQYLYDVDTQHRNMTPYLHTGMHNIPKVIPHLRTGIDPGHLFLVQPTLGSGHHMGPLRDLGLEFTSTDLDEFEDYALVVTCAVSSSTQPIILRLQYDREVIPSSKAESMVSLFERLVRQMMDIANGASLSRDNISRALLGDLKLQDTLSAMELQTADLTSCESAWSITITEPIRTVSHNSPHGIAIDAWDGTISYEQLDLCISRLSSYLTDLGITRQTAVCVFMEKSSTVPVTMLSILHAGGVVVPLGIQQPASRIQSILNDSGARFAICDPSTAHKLKVVDPSLQVLVVDAAVLEGLPPSSQDLQQSPHAQAEDIAFMIYSSGSTGTPKGIALQHQAIAVTLRRLGYEGQFSQSSRVLQYAAYTWDVSIKEMFATLFFGGTICIPSETDRLDMDLLSSFIRSKGVTHAYPTPTVASLLDPEQVPSIKYLGLGGEPLRPDVAKLWLGHAEITNLYGPTESGMCVLWGTPVQRAEDAGRLGRPQEASVWVCDPDNYHRLVPVGAPGELMIAGPTLAKGYLKNTEMTQAAFVCDARFADSLGLSSQHRRMYRTGDLVSQNSDGTFNFIGRRDTQLKIRGQRVDIGEIECRTKEIHLISDVAVVMAKDGPLAHRLVGFMCLHGQDSNAAGASQIVETEYIDSQVNAQVVKHLSASVMTYMIPRVWVQLVTLPRNSSGKVDRRSLSSWAGQLNNEQCDRYGEAINEDENLDEEQKCTSPSELKLQLICSEVLDLPISRISSRRTFLSLGGDSVAAIRAVAAARRHGVRLTVHDLLTAQSISDLAQRLVKSPQEHGETSDETTDTFFDLSPSQRLIVDRMAPEGLNTNGQCRFNQGGAICAKIPFGSNDIGNAVEALVAKHPMLRARFKCTLESGWKQRIEPCVPGSYRFQIHPRSSLTKAKDLAELAQDSLNLSEGPTFAVEILEIEDTRHVIFIAHSLVIDATSWGIMIRDLDQLLNRNTTLLSEVVTYRAWCDQLASSSNDVDMETTGEQLPVNMWEYWGLQPGQSVVADQLSTYATIGQTTMELVLGAANDAFHTDPVDIFGAAMLSAFAAVFPDRPMPAIYTEQQGRECAGGCVDLSDTVGCFTAMRPLYVCGASSDTVDMVLELQKCRQRRLGHRNLKTDMSLPFEVSFEFARSYPQDDHSEPLWNMVTPLTKAKQIGGGIRTLAALNVGLTLTGNQGRVKVSFSRHANHHDRIRLWTREFAHVMEDLARNLAACEHTPMHMDNLTLTDVTDVQEAYLSNHASHPEVDMTYTVMDSIDAVVPLDVQRMQHAYHEVLANFDALRLAFVKEQDMWKQYTVPVFRPTIKTYEINSDIDSWTQEFMSKQEFGPLKLGQPPIHLAMVIQIPSNAHRMIMRTSHALIDGISTAAFYEALAHAYIGIPIRKAPSFLDYVAAIQRQDSNNATTYWTDLLKGSSMTRLSSSSILLPSSGLASKGVIVGKATFRRNVPRGFTAAMLMKAAWALVLAKHAGCDDVVFADTVTGRVNVDPSVQSTLGCCIAAIPVRVDLSKAKSFRDLMNIVREQQFASMQFETHGMTRIMKECTDWHPDTMVTSAFTNALRDAESHIIDLGGNRYSVTMPADQPEQKYTLGQVYINWGQVGDQIDFTMKCAIDLLSEDVAEGLFNAMQRTCIQMFDDPDNSFTDHR